MDTLLVERASMKYGSVIGLATLLLAGARPALSGLPLKGGTVQLPMAALSAVETLGRSQEPFARYLGQAPPDQTTRVFRLETHDGYFAGDRIAISADGRELYYTEVTNTWSDYTIRYYKYSDGKWNGPLDLFRGFLGPALSVDDKTMWFEKYNDSRTCWHSKRTDTGWSTPTLCTDVPDPKDKHYLRDTASGRIYASSRGALNGIGQMDISTWAKADAQGAYHSLGRPLNSPGNEGAIAGPCENQTKGDAICRST